MLRSLRLNPLGPKRDEIHVGAVAKIVNHPLKTDSWRNYYQADTRPRLADCPDLT
jgi:hypothetical protein